MTKTEQTRLIFWEGLPTKSFKKVASIIFIVIFNFLLISCANNDSITDNSNNNHNEDSGFIYPSNIEINNSNLELYIGQSINLSYTIYPKNSNNKSVKWSSSNTSVATISSSGVVYAKKTGITSITVKTENNKSDSISVSVVKNKTNVTITSYNANNYFSISVSEGSSYGNTYKFIVRVSRVSWINIESYTTINVRVELLVKYKTSTSNIINLKTFSSNALNSFTSGTYQTSMSNTVSINVNSYSLPSNATIVGMSYSYTLSAATGRISY